MHPAALTGVYDFRLVALSIVLAFLASYAALDLAGRVTAARDFVRVAWLSGGALALGLGIWAMHYIAMLALTLPVAVSYDWPTVLASLAAAVGASAMALAIVSRPRMGIAQIAAGGVAMGLGIASMHYLGMQAMRMPAVCVYDPWLVACSIVIAVGVSIVALLLTHHFRAEQRSFTRAKLAGAAVMGAAIPLMHYSGMAAVRFVAARMDGDLSRSFTISSLALANIVGITVIVLALAIFTSFVDRRFSVHVAELTSGKKSLAASEGQSSKRAVRIAALSRVARETEQLSFEERAKAILEIATATMRPGRPTVGCLTHLDRGTIVIDDVTTMYGLAGDTFDRILTLIYPGNAFPVDQTMHDMLYHAGKTVGWECIDSRELDGRSAICDDFGIRSLIGTPVQIGSKTHFVVFEFLEDNLGDPFVEDDIAFVDVVGAFLANGFQRQLQSERLKYQMEHDALTGLANRIQLRAATHACIRIAEPFALAILNLDHFREVNVTFGNLIADELLVEVATSLAEVDGRDLVARRNGDEFAILLRGATAFDIDQRLRRYIDEFATPFGTGDRDGKRLLSVGCAIGAALFPRDGFSGEAIAGHAQLALEFAQKRGGSVWLLYDAEMDAILDRRWLDRSEIDRGIARDEFTLHYQPTFDLATRAIVGAEALIRWNHPSRGLLMPADFVPFAEQHGLIGTLSHWVFKRLLLDIESGPQPLPPGVRCYMNLAAELLEDSDFASDVHARLLEEPSRARRLGFEITESGAMRNVQRSIFALESFRRIGISIAIDDFGTGFSSLAYLKHLPADVIKIDKSFVDGIPNDHKDATLTDTFIWLSNAFGFASLAEGIEREDQAAWLLAHGCRFGQGYLVSEPVTYAGFRAQLAVHGMVSPSDERNTA
jgi:diguanylate cyclase (GGDEF)-like protein